MVHAESSSPVPNKAENQYKERLFHAEKYDFLHVDKRYACTQRSENRIFAIDQRMRKSDFQNNVFKTWG